jgi:hypothetical protein
MEPMVFKAFRRLKAKWGRSGGHFSKVEGQRSDEHRLGDALKTMMEPRHMSVFARLWSHSKQVEETNKTARNGKKRKQ